MLVFFTLSPVLVQLQGSDDNFTGMDSNGSRGTVRLVPLNTVDINNPFLTVNLCDFAFPTSVLATDYPNFIVFANWD